MQLSVCLWKQWFTLVRFLLAAESSPNQKRKIMHLDPTTQIATGVVAKELKRFHETSSITFTCVDLMNL